MRKGQPAHGEAAGAGGVHLPRVLREEDGDEGQREAQVYLKELQSKPLNKDYTGEIADAVNTVVAYINEFEQEDTE